MADAKSRGRFVWHDLMTKDAAQAEAFYKAVTGWGTVRWEGPSPYTMWTADSTPIGGVMPMPASESAPPHWLGYISTPDVDATVNEAEGLGAITRVPPTDIPTVGRFAVLTDPQGAMFAVYTASNQTPGHDGPPTRGEFSWHELATAEPPAAFRFYQRLFGWERGQAMDMGEAGVYQIFSHEGRDRGGIFPKPKQMPASAWTHYILVGDADHAAELTTAHGGTVINGPMDVPDGDRIFQGVDPQGAAFACHSKKKAQ